MANEKRAADTSSDRVDTLFAVVDGAPHHFCQQTKDNNFEDQLILRLTEQVRKIVSNNYKVRATDWF